MLNQHPTQRNRLSWARAFLVGSVLLIVGGIYFFWDRLLPLAFAPRDSAVPSATVEQHATAGEASQESMSAPITVVAENLEIPWGVVQLPDKTLVVTQRTGSLVVISGATQKEIPVEGVYVRGEGGLLGATLHPNFSENNWIYLYLTTQEGGSVLNRVERYTLDAARAQLSEKVVVLDEIPGAANHNGGRVAFGPDGFLYVTTGDAQQDTLAQDLSSMAGKILRVTDTGAVPADNPFNSPVYAYGFRNPQGLAWERDGQLWVTDHGPSGKTLDLMR